MAVRKRVCVFGVCNKKKASVDVVVRNGWIEGQRIGAVAFSGQ